MTTSFLPLVELCDNFRPSAHRDALVPLCWSLDPRSAVGLLWPDIIDALRTENELMSKEGQKPSWTIVPRIKPGNATKDLAAVAGVKSVNFSPHLSSRSLRSAAIASTCMRWHTSGLFSNVIGGRMWRNELYPVYANPFQATNSPEGIVFEVERSCAALFGVITYGVHMTIYQLPSPGSTGEEMRIWVPTRARTKQTWSGYLDNSVAGGIEAGYSPFESLVKESMEEASISESIVRKHARTCGAISYFFQKNGKWLQPEVEYVYQLEIPDSLPPDQFDTFKPKPLDGEVESFEFLSLSEVIDRMHKKQFKPNCAVVLIDFLIQHGIITPENEPNFLEIQTRLHGRFEFESWPAL